MALQLAEMQMVIDHAWVWFIAPIGAVVALLFAFGFSRSVMSKSEGEPEMVRIAEAVRQGAMAYLVRQYKVVFIVFFVLVAILVVLGLLDIQPLWTAAGVPIAGLFSGLCGWFGMKMATNASARTTWAAKQSLNDGLTVAFRSGAVMGLVVVGFALLDVSAWFFLWNEVIPNSGLEEVTAIMLTYGMGASTQALFARVGGGIYTKAADVGADLVGKVEAGIPEDDPRNPAAIADNVGDNVGDVAGMGADLYESYYGSILASMALGATAALSGAFGEMTDRMAYILASAPMALAGLGIICSLLGVFVVRAKEDASFSQLLKGLHMGVWVASALVACGAGVLFWLLLKDPDVAQYYAWWQPTLAIVTGLSAGLIIAFATEYYTSYEHAPTQRIAEQTQTGHATVIIAGIAEGMKSTWAPLLVIVVAILLAFGFSGGNDNFLLGLYGVGIAAVGMLSTLGITLATDAYGPIADNAGGNAEMTGQPPFVRERTDMLDSLGNTTAATGKGFAIGSAALTALALLAAYAIVVNVALVKKHSVDQWATPLVAIGGDGFDASSVSTFKKNRPVPGEVITLDLRNMGQGEFRIVAKDPGGALYKGGDNAGGALMLGSRRVVTGFNDICPVGSDIMVKAVWQDHNGVYDVTAKGEDGVPIEFDLVPSDIATLRHLAAFYDISIMNPRVLGGLFLGVMLAFVFCAMTMNAVGRAAYRMMNECRRQFGLMRDKFRSDGMSEEDVDDPMKWPTRVTINGVEYPDYQECVSISTSGAQREMVFPAILAISTPIIVGLILGVGGVMGLLVGGLTSGFAVAIYMANSGGAWDNAKKYIEAGHHGGKGSDAHKASVTGDTVGDPFKDTSGPSLNILIKLIAVVSVVFAGLVVHFGPSVQAALGLG
ncbi:MAG: sodium-translocating pyrophosphatase [Phycisphaerae bacterium]|nr:sodium-translocating pyrophosphatase [Phycisphaerae bacterium]|tara:strand:+ start:28928 stop:31591 length:2664 start_codon:yes stop_codon:yes gene_type:complete